MDNRPLTVKEQRLQRQADEYFDKAVNADSPVLAERYERLGNARQRELDLIRRQQ